MCVVQCTVKYVVVIQGPSQPVELTYILYIFSKQDEDMKGIHSLMNAAAPSHLVPFLFTKFYSLFFPFTILVSSFILINYLKYDEVALDLWDKFRLQGLFIDILNTVYKR